MDNYQKGVGTTFDEDNIEDEEATETAIEEYFAKCLGRKETRFFKWCGWRLY